MCFKWAHVQVNSVSRKEKKNYIMKLLMLVWIRGGPLCKHGTQGGLVCFSVRTLTVCPTRFNVPDISIEDIDPIFLFIWIHLTLLLLSNAILYSETSFQGGVGFWWYLSGKQESLKIFWIITKLNCKLQKSTPFKLHALTSLGKRFKRGGKDTA